jgi:hypothetical protein
MNNFFFLGMGPLASRGGLYLQKDPVIPTSPLLFHHAFIRNISPGDKRVRE